MEACMGAWRVASRNRFRRSRRTPLRTCSINARKRLLIATILTTNPTTLLNTILGITFDTILDITLVTILIMSNFMTIILRRDVIDTVVIILNTNRAPRITKTAPCREYSMLQSTMTSTATSTTLGKVHTDGTTRRFTSILPTDHTTHTARTTHVTTTQRCYGVRRRVTSNCATNRPKSRPNGC